jgi:hypothetical protein
MALYDPPQPQQRGQLWAYIAHERYTLLTFGLGALVLADLGWTYALLYLGYCGLALVWFMAFICTRCANAPHCPGGLGRLALRLFGTRDGEDVARTFPRAFRRNVTLMYPCWFIPLILGIGRLARSFTWARLGLLGAFSLIAFVVLPLASDRGECATCAMRASCPRAGGRARNEKR